MGRLDRLMDEIADARVNNYILRAVAEYTKVPLRRLIDETIGHRKAIEVFEPDTLAVLLKVQRGLLEAFAHGILETPENELPELHEAEDEFRELGKTLIGKLK